MNYASTIATEIPNTAKQNTTRVALIGTLHTAMTTVPSTSLITCNTTMDFITCARNRFTAEKQLSPSA